MDFNSLQAVKVEREGGTTFVTLNRPDKRNAMSPQLHFEMVEVLKELAEDFRDARSRLDGSRRQLVCGAGYQAVLPRS